jgi:hypothetical protein
MFVGYLKSWQHNRIRRQNMFVGYLKPWQHNGIRRNPAAHGFLPVGSSTSNGSFEASDTATIVEINHGMSRRSVLWTQRFVRS